MRGVTFAYLGPEAEASKFAKKGTTTDITLFNAKQGDDHLNLVHPARYPEKLQSLLVALDLADEIVLHPTQIDRSFGETVVGAELFGKTKGFVRIPPTVVKEQISGLLDKTALKDIDYSSDPDGVLREKLYARAAAPTEGPLVLPIDHAFPVKGVGTVILGLVRSGAVSTHQKLQVYPGDKQIEVRSIQVHDVDVPSAGSRSRVGLAVKGVEPDEVNRGKVLALPGSLKVLAAGAPLALKVSLSPFTKTQLRSGIVLHMFHMLQDLVFRVDGVQGATKEGATVTGKLETPMAYVPSQPVVLVDLDNKAQRFVGRAVPAG